MLVLPLDISSAPRDVVTRAETVPKRRSVSISQLELETLFQEQSSDFRDRQDWLGMVEREQDESREKEKRSPICACSSLEKTANAPAVLEICLSSAPCNTSITLDPQSTLACGLDSSLATRSVPVSLETVQKIEKCGDADP